MANDKMEFEGTVVNKHPGGKFTVEIPTGDKKKEIFCTISGKLRQNFIRIIPGDTVTVAISPYDLDRGIIVWRGKKKGDNDEQ